MANLNNLNKISQKRKKIVYGYIHKMQSVLFASNKGIIPKGIICICILFYGDLDKYDPLMKAAGIKLSNDNMRATSQRGKAESCMLTRNVETGYYSWKFKIKKVSGFMIIGIWMVGKETERAINTYFTIDGSGYGYCCHFARITDPDSGFTNYADYAIKCKSGMIVEMFVDFDKLSLSYKVNGKQYGKSHDIVQHKYRAAVYMLCKGDCVEILDCSSKNE
eukprot:42465_1